MRCVAVRHAQADSFPQWGTDNTMWSFEGVTGDKEEKPSLASNEKMLTKAAPHERPLAMDSKGKSKSRR